jgi:hypothetical protein
VMPMKHGRVNTVSSQTLSHDPSKVWFQGIQNPCKTEYGDLRLNYANLRRNLGMCFLACVYFFFLTYTFWILSSKHHGLLTTFLQRQAVTGCSNHFNWLELHLTKMMDMEKWAKTFGQCDVRPQLMHSKLNSKNAVGITGKCRSQTIYAVVRVKATFC